MRRRLTALACREETLERKPESVLSALKDVC